MKAKKKVKNKSLQYSTLKKMLDDVNLHIDFLDYQLHHQMLLVNKMKSERILLIKKRKIYEKKLSSIPTPTFGDVVDFDDLPF